MRISNQPEDVLVTYALGSCAGVSIFDPQAGVAGLIHCMLPLSKIDREKACKRPYMFIDTGIPELFAAAYKLGANKERIVIKVAGCSQILDTNGQFNIGKRNHSTLRKLLWRNNLLIASEDVGGSLSRTMYLEVGSGQVSIKSNGQIRGL